MNQMLRRGLKAVGITTLPPLDHELVALQRLFKAPPMTKDLVAAIKLISPQFDLTTSEKCKVFWEADQNGACWGEYNALAPLFHAMPRPAKILEIGPGLGRSVVFFSKKLGWESSKIHVHEGDGRATRYTILGPRFEDSFCGNIDMLRRVLAYNGIGNVTIFDANDIPLAHLPGPYDFIYSFYSIGFHWSLEHFLDDLLLLMDNGSVAVFTVPNEFKPCGGLDALSYKITDWKTVWPKDGKLKMLIVGKKSIPNL